MKRAVFAAFVFLSWMSAALAQSGTPGVPMAVTTNNVLSTYAGSKNFANSSAGDAYCLYGSSTKTVLVKRVRVSAVASAIAVSNIELVLRSTLNTGGGLTSITATPMDAANPTSTASPMYFTSAPTQGTLVGVVRDRYLTISQTATNVVSVSEGLFVFDRDQMVTLRGPSQGLCVIVPATAGGNWSIVSEWIEQ